MADVTKERVGQHLRNLFGVLIKHPDGVQAKEALAQVAGMTDMTPHEAGEYESATSALQEAAEHRPDDPEVHYALGSLYRKRRAFRRALDEFETTLQKDRRHAKAAFARARTLVDLGEISKAEHAYRSFLRDFPEDPWADRARQDLADLEEGTREPGEPVEP